MELLNGADLKKMILAGSQNLSAQKELVDALNVFPVPDGDTGTNMALTFQAAAREVQQTNSVLLAEIAQKAANGSLMGARGNSGVILSQLLRGFAQGIGNKNEIDTREVAKAFQSAVDTAYKGVMKPVEGTVLTVAREAARAAQENCRRVTDVVDLLRLTIEQAKYTLNQTPEMLPVLKQVGVVDAGGKGLVIILEGALAALTGETPINEEEWEQVPSELPQQNGDIVQDLDQIEFQYCTEFIVKGQQLPLEKFRESLSTLGDSLMVVGTEEVAKVHVHSNHPGKVLETCLAHGTLHEVKISNMVEQHQEMAGSQQTEASQEAKAYGIVAVAVGEGLKRIFTSLGVDQIVEGGQTANPSIEDIVTAINRINADKVFVFPNNKNIILAAEQAKALVEKEIIVIPSRSVPQGISALICLDPEDSVENNQDKMLAALTRVVTGEVTYAVRDSRYEDREVREGDILGLGDGKIKVVGQALSQVLLDLMQEIMPEQGEIVTLFYGQDIAEEEAQGMQALIEENFPECEVELHYGGQPLYYYIFSIE